MMENVNNFVYFSSSPKHFPRPIVTTVWKLQKSFCHNRNFNYIPLFVFECEVVTNNFMKRIHQCCQQLVNISPSLTGLFSSNLPINTCAYIRVCPALSSDYNYQYQKRSAMQGREREIDTLSVRRPQPHTTNLWRKRR